MRKYLLMGGKKKESRKKPATSHCEEKRKKKKSWQEKKSGANIGGQLKVIYWQNLKKSDYLVEFPTRQD